MAEEKITDPVPASTKFVQPELVMTAVQLGQDCDCNLPWTRTVYRCLQPKQVCSTMHTQNALSNKCDSYIHQ